ncbi:hypothetical protein [Rubritalea tangerina]
MSSVSMLKRLAENLRRGVDAYLADDILACFYSASEGTAVAGSVSAS